MPKSRAQKEATLADLVAVLKRMKSIVFANYEGLTVQEVEALRRACKNEGVSYGVYKKTLLAKAFKEIGIDADPKAVAGNFATVVGLEDEVAPAKILATFAKTHEALAIKAGFLEGKMLDAKAVAALAKLPSKTELLGALVGTLNAPVSGFVHVLAGNLRGLVTALNQIKDAKASA